MHQQQQPTPTPDNAEAAEQTASSTNRPVQTVHSGAIGASVWQNKNDKFGITLSRSWKSEGEETQHSKTFYAGNREDLHKAIDQACDIAKALERSVEQRIQQLGSELSQ